MKKDQDLLLNLCGRGDKDMVQVARLCGVTVSGDPGEVVPSGNMLSEQLSK